MSHLTHVKHWFASRDIPYMALRAQLLLKRYGLTSRKAERRTTDCVSRLASFGCHPTLPTPGRVVRRYPGFCRQLQAMGAELAVHGYDHVDFRSLSRDETSSQFSRATAAFRAAGIRFDGFRAPYLGCTDQTRDIARESGCAYSSNRAILWNVVDRDQKRTAVFEQLCSFYRPSLSGATVSVPRLTGGLVEIPASIPDDLQLCDGLGYRSDAASKTWLRILDDVYRRGELFVLVFHPEAFERCGEAIERVVEKASRLKPLVWMATLRDIARWWVTKSSFSVQIDSRSNTLEIALQCNREATILVRGLATSAPTRPWMDRYHVVDARTFSVSSNVRPFIAVAPDIPPDTVDFLQQQGYILETSEEPSRYGVYLDAASVGRLSSEVELIEHIESSDAPLVRFWRWPREARSALAVTGDLDALSLMDYAERIITI
jgi:peptidoglycan/xylan/chitin deacetylase (PgdA/CDA1 family)